MAFYEDFIRIRSGTEMRSQIYEKNLLSIPCLFLCMQKVWCGPIPAQGVRARTTHKHKHAIFYYSNVKVGGDLLSHTLPGAVPSAQAGLASGFGKGPGVTPPH